MAWLRGLCSDTTGSTIRLPHWAWLQGRGQAQAQCCRVETQWLRHARTASVAAAILQSLHAGSHSPALYEKSGWSGPNMLA